MVYIMAIANANFLLPKNISITYLDVIFDVQWWPIKQILWKLTHHAATIVLHAEIQSPFQFSIT